MCLCKRVSIFHRKSICKINFIIEIIKSDQDNSFSSLDTENVHCVTIMLFCFVFLKKSKIKLIKCETVNNKPIVNQLFH